MNILETSLTKYRVMKKNVVVLNPNHIITTIVVVQHSGD